MEKNIQNNILHDCSSAFISARKNIYMGIAILYKIQQESLWEGQFSSLNEYIEQECQISKGYASKLLQSWKYFVVDGGVLRQNLIGIDPDKLYFALRLPKGTIEQRLVKAREWNREDLRAELAIVDGEECKHPLDKRVSLCSACGKRVD
jgi:hypothetical protein